MKTNNTLIKKFVLLTATSLFFATLCSCGNLSENSSDADIISENTSNNVSEDAAEELEETYDAINEAFYEWYINIGTSLPEDASPDYSRYNLYDTVEKGDIIFEERGGFAVTGHIAIVEGKFYDEASDTYYIRIIEAKSIGVVRSCLDDTRVDDKIVTVLRVRGADKEIIDGAVDFCISQLGKAYICDLEKDYSPDEEDWYCSELVWAAYYNQGIDLEFENEGEPGVSPRDLRESKKTYEVYFK